MYDRVQELLREIHDAVPVVDCPRRLLTWIDCLRIAANRAVGASFPYRVLVEGERPDAGFFVDEIRWVEEHFDLFRADTALRDEWQRRLSQITITDNPESPFWDSKHFTALANQLWKHLRQIVVKRPDWCPHRIDRDWPDQPPSVRMNRLCSALRTRLQVGLSDRCVIPPPSFNRS
jgi:hypothetical protein